MKERKSLFIEFFGDYPIIRVLDFLIMNRIFDYTKTEICEESDVSWNTLELFWNKLVKRKIVKLTRNIGRAQLYQLNTENIMVKQLLEFNKKLMRHSIECLASTDFKTPAKRKVSVRT